MRVRHLQVNQSYDYVKNTAWLKDFYKNKTVFCIGSGPSLKGFDFSKLKGCATVVSNHAYLSFLSLGFKPEILVALDAAFFKFLKERNHNVADIAHRVFAGPASGQHAAPNVYLFLTNSRAFCNKTYQFYSPVLSGIVALSIAIVSGARKIVMLGYDCSEKHYYSDTFKHPVDVRPNHYVTQAKRFNAFSDYKSKIINACPDSTIEIFDKIQLSEVKYEKLS